MIIDRMLAKNPDLSSASTHGFVRAVDGTITTFDVLGELGLPQPVLTQAGLLQEHIGTLLPVHTASCVRWTAL